MTLDAALGAAHSLPCDAPQQALALVTVGWRGGRPQHKVVRRRRGNGINQSLQALLVHVHLELLVVQRGPWYGGREASVALCGRHCLNMVQLCVGEYNYMY